MQWPHTLKEGALLSEGSLVCKVCELVLFATTPSTLTSYSQAEFHGEQLRLLAVTMAFTETPSAIPN